MIQDIKAIDGYEQKTPEEIAAILQTLTDTITDPTAWTIGAIANQSPELAGKLELSLDAMRVAGIPFAGSTLTAASTVGLQIHTPQRQGLIDQLAAASQSLPEPLRWDAEFVAAIKSLGIRDVSRYPEVTPQQVADAISADSNQQSDETRYQVLLSANRSPDGTLNCMARVTPIEFFEGQEIRRLESQTVSTPQLKQAVAAIVEDLIDG